MQRPEHEGTSFEAQPVIFSLPLPNGFVSNDWIREITTISQAVCGEIE